MESGDPAGESESSRIRLAPAWTGNLGGQEDPLGKWKVFVNCQIGILVSWDLIPKEQKICTHDM